MPDMGNASRRFALAVALALVGAQVGCGVDVSSYGAFVKEVVRVRCDALFDCCNAQELGALEFRTRQECEDSFPELGSLIPTYTRFDAAQAKRCVATLEAELSTCDPPVHYTRTPSGKGHLPPDCLTVLVGTTPQGGECTGSEECAPGLVCEAEALDFEAPRHCATGRTEGQPCDFYLMPCTPDLYCTGAPGVCAKPKAVGALCPFDDACESQSCSTSCLAVSGRSLVCDSDYFSR